MQPNHARSEDSIQQQPSENARGQHHAQYQEHPQYHHQHPTPSRTRHQPDRGAQQSNVQQISPHLQQSTPKRHHQTDSPSMATSASHVATHPSNSVTNAAVTSHPGVPLATHCLAASGRPPVFRNVSNAQAGTPHSKHGQVSGPSSGQVPVQPPLPERQGARQGGDGTRVGGSVTEIVNSGVFAEDSDDDDVMWQIASLADGSQAKHVPDQQPQWQQQNEQQHQAGHPQRCQQQAKGQHQHSHQQLSQRQQQLQSQHAVGPQQHRSNSEGGPPWSGGLSAPASSAGVHGHHRGPPWSGSSHNSTQLPFAITPMHSGVTTQATLDQQPSAAHTQAAGANTSALRVLQGGRVPMGPPPPRQPVTPAGKQQTTSRSDCVAASTPGCPSSGDPKSLVSACLFC